MSELTFRNAEEQDCGKILYFIKQLAVYEKMEDQVVATEEILREWIFEKKKAEVIFGCLDGKEIGFAVFFHNFSTFLGRAGIYLEDLFVLPEYRGRGFGKAFLVKLAETALERGCGRWWPGINGSFRVCKRRGDEACLGRHLSAFCKSQREEIWH